MEVGTINYLTYFGRGLYLSFGENRHDGNQSKCDINQKGILPYQEVLKSGRLNGFINEKINRFISLFP